MWQGLQYEWHSNERMDTRWPRHLNRLFSFCDLYVMWNDYVIWLHMSYYGKRRFFAKKRRFFAKKGVFLPKRILTAKPRNSYRQTLVFFLPKIWAKWQSKNCKAFFCQTFGQHWSASWSPRVFWPHSTPPFPPVFPFSPHFSIIFAFFSPFFLLPPFFRPSFSPPPFFPFSLFHLRDMFWGFKTRRRNVPFYPNCPQKTLPFFIRPKVAKMTQPGPKSMHNFPAKTPILPHRACFARMPSSPLFSPFFPSLFPASFPLLCPFFPLFPPFFVCFLCEQSFVKQPKRKMIKQFLKSLKQLFHPKGLFGTVLSQYRTMLGGKVGSFKRGPLFGSAKGVWVLQFQQSESPFFGPKNVRNGLLMSLFWCFDQSRQSEQYFSILCRLLSNLLLEKREAIWAQQIQDSTSNVNFCKNPFQAIRAAPGSKPTLSNPSPASNPSRSRFWKLTFIRLISGGGSCGIRVGTHFLCIFPCCSANASALFSSLGPL